MKPWFIFALVAIVGCTTPEEEEDPAEHACEQVTAAGTAITAAATREEDASAALSASEEPYTVTLPANSSGFVSIVSDEDTAALLFVGTADVAANLYLDDSTDDVLPEGAPNELCADDIPEHFDLDLEPGTWHLELGPSAVTEVWVMLLAGGHAH